MHEFTEKYMKFTRKSTFGTVFAPWRRTNPSFAAGVNSSTNVFHMALPIGPDVAEESGKAEGDHSAQQ
jgi:hypothetical protein